MLRITSLCDNVIEHKKCMAMEGASFLIEINNTKIIFDVGRSCDLLLHNLSIMGFDLNDIDYIILSHGHKGHIGAIEKLATQTALNTTIIFHEKIIVPKFKCLFNGDSTNYKPVGNKVIIDSLQNENIKKANSSFKICEGVFIISDTPVISKRFTSFSDRYRIFNQGYIVDEFAEELSLAIVIERGLIIVSACSHRGIDNIVSNSKLVTNIEFVYGIIGGVHTKDDIKKTSELIEYLKELNCDFVAPCHCTGIFSKSKIKESMDKQYCDFSTGKTLDLIGG